jgi:uncharacterized protein (DUF697 family)
MSNEPNSPAVSQEGETAATSTAPEPTRQELAAEPNRQELASKLVDRFALWSGVAGLIPVPVVDAATVAGLQLQMVRRISQIYDVNFSENIGKSLIAALAGAMVPATSSIGAASLLKAIPIVGTIASGFVMPVLASGATYAIGKAFIQHFETGGTLLDFNPPDYREFLRSQKELWDIRRKRLRTPDAPAAAVTPETEPPATATQP